MRGRKWVQKKGQDETDERQEIGSEERTERDYKRQEIGSEERTGRD